MGQFIDSSDFPNKDRSIFREAFELDIPATVHVAVGSDIIHMHPEADGAAIGKGASGTSGSFQQSLQTSMEVSSLTWAPRSFFRRCSSRR